MKKNAALCFVLLLGLPALAQQSTPFEGGWDCQTVYYPEEHIACSATCGEGFDHWSAVPPGMDCPLASWGHCTLFLSPKPMCYPPGTAPGEQTPDPPDPPEDPVDPGDGETASFSGGGDNLHRDQKALIAGGTAVLAAFFWRHYGPEWIGRTGGVSVRPTTHVAYRDGFAMAQAGFTAEWEGWRLTAGSSHDGTGWSRPRGRLDWRWSWEF